MALRLALVTILAPMFSDTANQYYVEGAVAGDAGVTCEILVDNSLQRSLAARISVLSCFCMILASRSINFRNIDIWMRLPQAHTLFSRTSLFLLNFVS